MSFVHLHVHSMYSLLDGFSNIKKLVERTRELGMPAVALTDHGTMYGVIEFYLAAQKAGVKPIVGLEIYIAARGMTNRDAQHDKKSSHLVLIAENDTGYSNLLQIASAAQLEGFYYYPRIDHDYLAAHAEGLIAMTACMSGEVPRAVLEGDSEKANRLLDYYFGLFGRDRFFLELQQHNIPELQMINRSLVDLGRRYNARYVATNDVHYIRQEDARLQDILLAIQTGSVLTDPNRMHMGDDSYYLRTPEEMAVLFRDMPEAIHTTLEIGERCHINLIKKGYHLPEFPVPEGYTSETYLRRLCEEGFARRYGERASDPLARERLEYELGIIHQMGFDAYFIIVWDLCRFAQQQGIWYNARGSAAGSMVAYTLDITLVEPLQHGLIFERFLNPDRVSMPDIDLDFQDDRRAEMMEYCAQKYGHDKVAQIITFGTLGARAAIRDVGRVMDIPLTEVDRISKMIPAIPGKPVVIVEALEQVPELKQIYDSTPYLKDLIDTAALMEGVARSAGTHAAGVVIADKPIVSYAPLNRPTSGSEDSPIKTVTQFEMSIVEALGLLKVDFLGLSTLTIMQRACQLIRQRHNKIYNLSNIPLDDPETFEMLGQGHTAGVFQLEGSGMTRYIVQMKPRNLDNIIAMVALFRPGPLEFIPSYIRRMHGEEEVTFRHAALQPIFQDTYGIPIYQEQIMFAAMELASYKASEADDLRKAISKKKADQIQLHRQKFIKGSVSNGIPEITAADIFTDWENFARYGFNKSHAADYGVIAVETAYLKTHYAVEYMAALLSASKNDTAKVAFYVTDSRSMGIDVLPPDINHGGWDFSIEDRPDQSPAIRFGMGAIKNVGSNSVELLTNARAAGDPFVSLSDLARRVDLRQVGKRALECLIKAGALDAFGPRLALLEALDRLIAISTSHFRAAQSGQMSIFGMVEEVQEDISLPVVKVDQREQLEWERELIGLYVSDHPLSPYLALMQRKVTHFSAQLSEAKPKEKVVVAGLVTRFRPHRSKSGKDMGFATLEDIQGEIELVIFPSTWERYGHLVVFDHVLCAEGKADTEGSSPKVLVDSLSLLRLDEEAAEAANTTVTSSQPAADFFLPPEDGTSDGLIESAESLYSLDQEPEFAPLEDIIADLTPVYAARPSSSQPQPGRSQVAGGYVELPKDTPTPQPEEKPAAGGTTLPLAANQVGVESQKLRSPQLQPVQAPAVERMPQTAPSFVPLQYLVSPTSMGLGKVAEKDADRPRMLTVVLRPSGDKDRDVRRLRRIHGEVNGFPGQDHFSFLIFEGGHHYLMEFPNDTTGITPELLRRLAEMVGEENIRVEPIKVQ